MSHSLITLLMSLRVLGASRVQARRVLPQCCLWSDDFYFFFMIERIGVIMNL